MKKELAKGPKNKTLKNVKVNRKKNIDDDDEGPKKWFEEVAPDPKSFGPVTEQVLIELKDEAKKCHDSEIANYNIKNSKTNSDYQWMKTVMIKGTVSDKIAAHTVSIQDNPICNLETLRNLVSMVKVGKKRECFTVIETLTELFLSDLLRPDQKLKAFHQRPLSLLTELSSGNAVSRRKLLSAWYFEDQLKEVYTSYVLALNAAAQDTVENNKEKAISAMYKLLAGNGEQEKNLLTYIVNKLGDPSQKVASKAIYCLNQLLFKHPNMQGVVLNEIEKLLFRANISTRAQYYGLCFLSQFYLNQEESEVARKLIEVYFSFFKACVKKGEVDSRMMSAILMGINRAYPYAKLEMDKISEHVDTIYRIVHIANFNVSLHALNLLYQVSDSGNNVTDRFYSALYKKLVDSNVVVTTHQAMLLSLVYKALLKDKEISRVKVFVKRLLQISLFASPCFACGILYLISQLMEKKENLQSLLLKQTSLSGIDDEDDEDERYFDVKDETEFVEVKDEENETPEKVQNEIVHNSKTNEDEEDVKPDIKDFDIPVGTPSWYHATKKEKSKNVTSYNPHSRNPLYAGGEFCAYTELSHLRNHFHPTVSLYASNLISGELVKYTGDPLKDFTLIRFLDRFVFKNPKKIDGKAGVHPTFGKRKVYKPKGVRLLPVNSDNYLKENQTNIPVDEKFMYAYLQKKYENRQMKDGDDSDLESVQSEEFDEMIDKMSEYKDFLDNDIDFMDEIGDNLKKKTQNKKVKGGSDSDDEEDSEDEDLSGDEEFQDEDDLEGDEVDDLSDEEDEFGDLDDEDKELIGDLDDDDEEDIAFDEDFDKKSKKAKKNLKNGNDIKSLFASADEFASILEDEGSSKIKPGGSNAFANKDNANMKQLDWEDKRNRWLNGFNKAVGGKSKKFGSKSREFGKKRPNRSKFENKNKKFKNK